MIAMKNRTPLKNPAHYARIRKIFRIAAACVILGAFCIVPAAAAPSSGITNTINLFMEILLGVVRAIGAILALWGVVELGIALKAHDASQRASAIKSLAAGLLVFFAGQILDSVGITI